MYSAKVNGEPTQFGTSGLLYRSNKIMYDRATRTLWSHLLGEPVIGPLVGSGARLEYFPVVLTTWAEWVEEHPDTRVMDINTGEYPASFYLPEDNEYAIYYDYFYSRDTMFPVWQRNKTLRTKDVVLALDIGGQAKAYPVRLLQRQGVVNDTLGGTRLVVIASSDTQAARAYHTGDHTFASPADGTGLVDGPQAQVLDSSGTAWRVEEDYLISTADPMDRLRRLPSHMAFWFGWYAQHPDTLVHGVPREGATGTP